MSFIDGSIDPKNDDHIVLPHIMCNSCGKKPAEQPYGFCTECRYSWIYTGGVVERRFRQKICSCNHHEGAHVVYGYDYKNDKPLYVCMMFDYKNRKICECREFKESVAIVC